MRDFAGIMLENGRISIESERGGSHGTIPDRRDSAGRRPKYCLLYQPVTSSGLEVIEESWYFNLKEVNAALRCLLNGGWDCEITIGRIHYA